MKRLITALLAAVLCFAASTTDAAPVQLRWITNSSTFSTYQGDSATVREGSGQNCDTTSAFELWRFKKPGVLRTAAAVDTMDWFRVDFAPVAEGGLTAGADSIYLGVQVSRNKSDWVTITPTTVFEVTGKDGTLNGIVLQETGSSNSFGYTLPLVLAAIPEYGKNGHNSTTAPTELQLSNWNYMRFIVQGDFTGKFGAWVTEVQQ